MIDLQGCFLVIQIEIFQLKRHIIFVFCFLGTSLVLIIDGEGAFQRISDIASRQSSAVLVSSSGVQVSINTMKSIK
jgi:hypothetical protein